MRLVARSGGFSRAASARTTVKSSPAGATSTSATPLEIRREYTAPGKPQQNAVVESAIWRAMKGGHAARRKIRRVFSKVDLPRIPHLVASGHHLRLEAVLWAADWFNRSATKTNTGWRSPYEVFCSRLLDLQVAPFFQEGMMRVDHDKSASASNGLCPGSRRGRIAVRIGAP